jgi:anti-anti-sigma regulatory factor
MGDSDTGREHREPPLVGSAASDPWGSASVRSHTAGGVMLVEVEGELDAPALRSWTKLLNFAVTGGATGVTVDLRGCRVIDIGCLSTLVVASGRLRERGDPGINLVMTPGSAMERRVGASAANGLPGYSSAGEALRSLRHVAYTPRAPGRSVSLLRREILRLHQSRRTSSD